MDDAGVACKLATGKDQKPPDPFHCREVLGHVLPNWDAPGADRYFEDAKTSPADVLAMAAAEAVVPVRAPPKKKRPRSPGPGSPPPRHRIKAPTGPRPTGAMSDLKQGPTRAAAPAPRGDFGLKKPLVRRPRGEPTSKLSPKLRRDALRNPSGAGRGPAARCHVDNSEGRVAVTPRPRRGYSGGRRRLAEVGTGRSGTREAPTPRSSAS